LKVSSSSSLLVVIFAATMATLKPMSSKAISLSPILISASHIFSTDGKLKYRAMKLGGISLKE
jgi:hypothetical protein